LMKNCEWNGRWTKLTERGGVSHSLSKKPPKFGSILIGDHHWGKKSRNENEKENSGCIWLGPFFMPLQNLWSNKKEISLTGRLVTLGESLKKFGVPEEVAQHHSILRGMECSPGCCFCPPLS